MVALASVADPRLFDPRVGDDKTYITTMDMQQTSVHGRTTGLPHAARQAGKAEPGDLLHHCQGLLLDHSGKKGVSSRITFESIWTMEAGITTFIWFLVCSLWLLLSQWLSCLVQFHLRGRG